jgi:integrase/recombinase XerD
MLKGFMKWYGEPLEDLKIKIPKSLPPYTENSQIEKLLKAIEGKKTHRGTIARDILLIELILKTGLRRGEISNLEIRDIHGEFLVVREGKGRKDRVIPLSERMVAKLADFTKRKDPNEKVFGLKPPSITMKIKGYARRAGVEELHTHALRHKFATDLLERGANIKVVQELLGHENLATTEVYLSVTNQSLRDAVGLLDKEVYPPLLKQRGEKDEITTVMRSVEELNKVIKTGNRKRKHTDRKKRTARASYYLGAPL